MNYSRTARAVEIPGCLLCTTTTAAGIAGSEPFSVEKLKAHVMWTFGIRDGLGESHAMQSHRTGTFRLRVAAKSSSGCSGLV